MLALHGIQDNAATFDKLVPLLEVKSVLALDIPGHGQSSHIPQGFLYYYMDAVCVMRFVINHHFKWKQPVELLGHSFGSSLSFVYAALYPDQVSKYISLDCSRHAMAAAPNSVVSTLNKTIEKTLDYEGIKEPPEYSYEVLLDLFYKGRKCRLKKESCDILLSRGTTLLDNGKVRFSRDVRLKLTAVASLTYDDLLELAPKIRCDVLSIQAENGVVKNDLRGDIYRKTVEDMIQNSAKSRHIVLPGGHHFHLDNPEPVAREVNAFLTS